MDEKTKTIIDRARALLAAATQGPVAVYPHPRPRQDHDESRFQWGDLVTGGRSMWTMIPMADAEALAFAVNNLGAICDALEAAERRAEEAEAQAAAMREELPHLLDSHRKWLEASARADETEAYIEQQNESSWPFRGNGPAAAHQRLDEESSKAEDLHSTFVRALDDFGSHGRALIDRMRAAEAKSARMVARVCAGCHGRGLAHLDGDSPRCAACGGSGAVIVEGGE